MMTDRGSRARTDGGTMIVEQLAKTHKCAVGGERPALYGLQRELMELKKC